MSDNRGAHVLEVWIREVLVKSSTDDFETRTFPRAIAIFKIVTLLSTACLTKKLTIFFFCCCWHRKNEL